MNIDYSQELPVLERSITLADIDRLIAKPLDEKPDKKFFIALSITLTLLLIGAVSVTYLFLNGTGVWGLNQPVGWAFDITNFVFWVGIGHAGTLISAVLYLLRQKWRTGIARFAEAMTIFAVMSPELNVGVTHDIPTTSGSKSITSFSFSFDKFFVWTKRK